MLTNYTFMWYYKRVAKRLLKGIPMDYSNKNPLPPIMKMTEVKGLEAPSERMVFALKEYAIWASVQATKEVEIGNKIHQSAWLLWNNFCARMAQFTEARADLKYSPAEAVMQQYVSMIGNIETYEECHYRRYTDGIGQYDTIERLVDNVGSNYHQSKIQEVRVSSAIVLATQLVEWLKVEQQRNRHELNLLKILMEEFSQILDENQDVGLMSEYKERFEFRQKYYQEECANIVKTISDVMTPKTSEGKLANVDQWVEECIALYQMARAHHQENVAKYAYAYAQRAAEIEQENAQKKEQAKARRAERKAKRQAQ